MLRRRLLSVLQRYAPNTAARVRDWLWRRDRYAEYDVRKTQERARFAGELDVGALPPIYVYWANRHLRPVLESLGFSHPEDFYAREIERVAQRVARPLRMLSVGCGNCDTEVRIARLLRERGVQAWTLVCLDLTAPMLERGRDLAATEGFGDRFEFVAADLAEWRTDERFDVVIANQCLHHIVELERVFARISDVMAGDGVFLTSDMVGRNGHQRWPEAKAIVDSFWPELPKKYRYNRQLRRQENRFRDWDCSIAGFEGIRAQDILPLLVQRFDFEFFYAFGNVVDPFIDRGFGWNFDADAEWDRDFIDRVHAADEAAIESGSIKPTHMLATMRHRQGIVPRTWRDRTPERCVRPVA
ncbi:MAG TPA: class I SAM-dependent methyltransferase [Xanthomonadales bacterium]|nr:class I SAM-dependent methyltransferase [Xanthomonadales bacterium]